VSDSVIYEENRIKSFVRRTVTIIKEEYVYREIIPHEIPTGFRKIFTESESLKETILDDLDERKELAKIIGLDRIPERTMDAFEEIPGLLDELVSKNEEVDAVKMIKALRKRC